MGCAGPDCGLGWEGNREKNLMAMGRRFGSREPHGPQIRVNHRIRVPEVRVVGEDGSMVGVMTTQDALRRAQAAGLDLVEVNPKSQPPVCKILDYGKFKYDEKKRAADAKRKQTVVEVKEIKLRPKTDDHDIEVKVRASRRFLEAGNKVKLTVRFRGREIMHPQIAHAQLDLIRSQCEDLCNVEMRPAMEGRQLFLIMAPKPQVMQRVQQERSQRLKEGKSNPSNEAPSPDGEEESDPDASAEEESAPDTSAKEA